MIKFAFSVSKDKLFQLSLIHSVNHGFNEAAIAAACSDLSLSSASISMIKPIDLIHHSMRQWNRTIIDQMNFDEQFKEQKIPLKIRSLIKERLQLQVPYIQHWPAAMKLGALHCSTSQILWQFADDSWVLAGDRSTDYNYYTKRSLFLSAYITTELFLLTDKSDNNMQTWAFLDRRLDDIKNIGQQADFLKNLGNTLATSGYFMLTALKPPQGGKMPPKD